LFESIREKAVLPKKSAVVFGPVQRQRILEVAVVATPGDVVGDCGENGSAGGGPQSKVSAAAGLSRENASV
jgi:hypothetical protein